MAVTKSCAGKLAGAMLLAVGVAITADAQTFRSRDVEAALDAAYAKYRNFA